MELYDELEKLNTELYKSVRNLRKAGSDYAEAYTKYRVLVAKELVKQRDLGQPVTIAGDIARGQEEVAKAKYNEICTEAVYKANMEAINTIKLRIKIVENQLEREWGNVK